MADINVNVLLKRGGSGQGRAKGTLSVKESSNIKKNINTSANKMIGLSTFINTGSMVKSAIMSIPVIRGIAVELKAVDKGLNFGANIYSAHSGEDMIVSNFKAISKAYTTAGMAYIEAGISNWLYTRPLVRRQNNMLDYGRNLYIRNIENEKNQFS